MAYCQVEKVDGYTIMANYHLRDRRLSLKAKGLLSMIFSLPPDWDMSVEGLAYISSECRGTIGRIIKELEEAGYVTRQRERRPDGTLGGTNYYISQKPTIPENITFSPKTKNPTLDNPTLENPALDNAPQLNKDIQNKEKINKEQSKKQSINPASAEADAIGLDKIVFVK